MPVNLADKMAGKVAERFKLGSLTESGVNKEYEWNGVNSIDVLSISTTALNDYVRTGTNRYGSPAELQDTKQTMLLAKDRAFAQTIDQGNFIQQQMLKRAGEALKREIDEVVIPEVDIYRILTMFNAANANNATTGAPTALSSSNAYLKFLAANELLDEKKVPALGRVAFVSPQTYNFLKLDPSFQKNSDLSYKNLINGQVGEVDGVKLVKVPSSYLPKTATGTATPVPIGFVIVHPSATVAPEQLNTTRIHENPPGINGWLIEGRMIYDAFVLDAKKDALAIHKNG